MAGCGRESYAGRNVNVCVTDEYTREFKCTFDNSQAKKKAQEQWNEEEAPSEDTRQAFEDRL